MRTKTIHILFPIFVFLILLADCTSATVTPSPAAPTTTPTPTEPSLTASPVSPTPSSSTETPSPAPTPEPFVSFAVIGDFGSNNQAESDMAKLIHSWDPDIILTVGDNNYPGGEAGTIDANIGQYFHDFIDPYTGTYGAGAAVNRFFPTLGNHDWYTKDAQPYLDYFSLPGNERYYDFVNGPVHFFALDSDENEPDGFRSTSIQAAWLKQGLAASTSPWNIVYFHYPPYSSGMHGSTPWMRWPFAAWGADAVLTAHDHTYERLSVDGIPYFVNGVGGGAIYNFINILPESKFRYNANYGAMRVTATDKDLLFEFFNRTGELIDQFDTKKP